MRQVNNLYLCLILSLGILVLLSPAQIHAQNERQPDDRQILMALLNEVRLLRLTIQRTSVNAYRAQIIVERLRIQQERVERLNRALEDVRNKLADLQIGIARHTEQGKEIESSISQESETNRRTQKEAEYKNFKEEISHQKLREQRLQGQEMQLSQLLHTEQAKLAGLESKLEDLEREIQNAMDVDPSTGKPPQSKK
jgi:predicted  nucleic acid-binding Zn-ribbon protein